MEKGFYAWYEDVFNQCSLFVNGPRVSNSGAKTGASVGTLLFSGKFSSSSVVIRMVKPYDFVFSGAWASSFKAFVYRQQNYNHILYELYADQLDSKLVKEHRNLYSFIEGRSPSERPNMNRVIGNRLDQVLKVILPLAECKELLELESTHLSVRSILKGVFLWQRDFFLVEGDDTFETMADAGVDIKVIQVNTYMLGGQIIKVKFAEIDCCGVHQFAVVIPYLAQVDALPIQISSFRHEIEAQLKGLNASKMSSDFVGTNVTDFLKP